MNSPVTKVRYYLPIGVGAAVLNCITMGLFTTFGINTSTATWVGYQILGGVGRGLGMQVVCSLPSPISCLPFKANPLQPIIAVQNNTPQSKLAITMTLVSFCNSMGGAIFLCLAQTTFDNSLLSALTHYAPNVNAQAVIAAGAGAVRHSANPQDIHGVLLAYSKAISNTFFLGLGAALATFLFAWGLGLKKLGKPKPKQKALTAEAGAEAELQQV